MPVHMSAWKFGKSFAITLFLKIKGKGQRCTDWCVMTYAITYGLLAWVHIEIL